MKVTKAEIVISAVSEAQYPTLSLPEIALAGRSNVGKSSFINRLINRRNLVRTSSKPGKTRTLNFYNINDRFLFVDVPGYGYAQVSKKERAKWGDMMEHYFETREPLSAVILVIDSRHKPTDDDINMYQYVKYLNLPTVIIATKVDKLKKQQRQKNLKLIKKTLQVNEDDIIILFSAETGEGKEAVWRVISQYI